jgi:acetyl-CoA carboxylase carboxyl transferase subunit beta
MSTRPTRGIPEGLWMSCPKCKATLYRKEVETKHLSVCPECGYHNVITARERIKQLLDEDSF